MRTFKVGDKVKFLNEVGGGIITKIISPSLVNVEVEGFEIPTLTKDIVLDFVDDPAGKMFTSLKELPNENTASYNEGQDLDSSLQEADTRQERLHLSRKGQQQEKGIYLAFVPCDQKWLISGEYFVYLVNNSDYTLLYSLFLRDEKEECFVGEDYGSVDPLSRYLLSTIEDKELEKWTNGTIQLLLHKDKSRSILMPTNCNIKIRTSKFFKEGCFERTELLDQKALITPILIIDTQDIAINYEKSLSQREQEAKQLQNLKADNVVVKVEPTKATSFFDKHLINKREGEVDLHIESLVDNVKGLSNVEILNIQMNYFRKCLDKAIEMNLDKIIFIHGIGQGTLKHNIEEELNKYSFIHYFPASMQKYGVGATEVIIGNTNKLV